MKRLRTPMIVGAIALAGALGTVLVGAALGMNADELEHLVRAMAIPAIASIVIAIVSARLLVEAPLRQRWIAVALIGAVVALANIAVLTVQMSVSDHDATLVTVLLVYAGAAGVAAAVAVARSSTVALERLGETARRLGEGDLEARAGTLGAGPELDTLAGTLDDMAEALQEARSREREAEQMRRDLITTISHDLRTPLASLRAMVEAIDERVVRDAPTLRRYAAEMRRSTDQLVTMVDDLFELTQLEAGAIAAETARATVQDVAASALATVGPHAETKGLHLRSEIALRVAATPCSPRIARVLQNLLINAVRHTPADGTVRLAASREGDRLLLTVQDTGPGIAPDDLVRVFEPFYRADPARSGPGAGLGLALAKRIVEALGGAIRVENTPGAGARFAVDLPVPG